MADIVLINPRFEVSFWGMEHSVQILGKRSAQPVASLPLLAALTPPEHTVTLIDENVEAIDFDRCARADIVGVTGMIVQRHRMKEILTELKGRGAFTVVGGPWVTVQEDYFEGLADAIFIGEAEETWPKFLREWPQRLHQYRYEQSDKTDMTKVPTPRVDLLKMQYYMAGTLQFSRGCPFQCEFCDIIVTFGRRPRIKTSAQIIAELEALLAQGVGGCFIVDDNLIGNKKAIKAVLRDVIDWQEKKGYPMVFSTEASIDLADDPELLELMWKANIGDVFIGIESPNEESLRETKKFQNVRAGGTLIEKVHRIQDAGIEVWCGMILGFDHDDRSIFDAQRRFIREARIIHVMLGMLYAVPKTPLHARLAAEGRLDLSDVSEFGTNVIPLNLTREELRDGYVEVLNDLHSPEVYLDRMEELFLRSNFKINQAENHLPRWSWRWVKIKLMVPCLAVVLFVMLMRGVPDAALRQEYRRRFGRLVLSRRNPRVILRYMFKCLMHYHAFTMARNMSSKKTPVYSTF